MNKTRKKDAYTNPSALKTCGRLFAKSFQSAPVWCCIALFCDLCNGVISGTFVLFTQRFFDQASVSAKFEWALLQSLLTLGGILLIQHIINGVGHTILPYFRNKVNQKAISNLNQKAGALPPILFENTDFLNHIEKAYQGSNFSRSVVVPIMRFAFLYLPYQIVVGGYLYVQDPILAVCMALIFVPTLIGYMIKPGILFRLEDESAPIRRANRHYRDCMIGKQMLKETRTLGAFQFFMDKYKNSLFELNRKQEKAQRTISLLELATSILTVIGYGGVLLLLGRSTQRGTLTPGAFAAVFSSMGYLFGMADELLWTLFQPVDGLASARHYLSLIDYPIEERPAEKADFHQDIFLDNVSFQYPNAAECAVQNVSLQMKAGETIALVGENGSGKTTLIRLILGLYQPSRGSVRIGSADSARTPYESNREGISAVFQNYQKYQMDLRTNVMISEPSRPAGDIEIQKLLRQNDVDITGEAFPDQLDTMLSPEFGGVDLSGGQWQRIAIARGLYRKSDLIVLDEPTAAIDPIEETKVYEKFVEIAAGRTAVLVTHRIGSARIADRIAVMDNGVLAELGTHEELMEKGGVYANMFQAQKKWYRYD